MKQLNDPIQRFFEQHYWWFLAITVFVVFPALLALIGLLGSMIWPVS